MEVMSTQSSLFPSFRGSTNTLIPGINELRTAARGFFDPLIAKGFIEYARELSFPKPQARKSFEISPTISVKGSIANTAGIVVIPHYEIRRIASAPSPLIRIMIKIRQMAAYEANWDGYDSEPPSQAAVNDAERFAVSNLAHSVYLPRISAASDGEINFSWKNERGLIDLGFFGDGSYSYYAKAVSGKEYFSDSAPLTALLPAELLEIVER
ncbi:hypothetical protein [Pseudomonas syringae]|uniref:hypothetical protein n=1 Tax=Pseudomonas syringae TaxID=317 RepID=UPI000464EC1D|nr:hypothetical protein [Pseudomonas syringae]QGG77746.1 hypothetical protein N028_21310 [Pseudomonas syringae USA011]